MIESMRQIKNKHAAPHHAQGKLQTAGAVKTCAMFNHYYSVKAFLLMASPLPHRDKIPDVPGIILSLLQIAGTH